jgi:hypothetical protein
MISGKPQFKKSYSQAFGIFSFSHYILWFQAAGGVRERDPHLLRLHRGERLSRGPRLCCHGITILLHLVNNLPNSGLLIRLSFYYM